MATKTIEVCDRCGTAPRAGLHKTVTAALLANGETIIESEPFNLCSRCVERAKRLLMAQGIETKVTK